WEYACRAGTQTPYQYGKTLTTQQARFNIATGPSPVGSFEANAIGLYDMHGNVTEWCEDFFGPYTVAPKDGTAQKVKTAEEFRVLRGGNWGDMVLACRSAYRIYHLPDFRTTNIHGFRVALDQDEPIEVKKADAAPPTVVKGDEMSYDLGNGVKLEIVKINAKGKKFLMGSPEEEPDRNPDENKFDAEEQHEVTFGHDFHIGKYEVTQSQYQAIMGHNPSTSANNPLHPVDSVSWNDVQDFLKKLNEKFKERKIDFRLPTEAEWEYACRAGTTTPYYFGKTLTKAQANFDESSTKPVGTFEANAFGLYDMHGNVCEWCADWFGPYSDAPKDGTAQSSKQAGDLRVLRGGLWSYIPNRCRSAYRGYIAPDDRKLSVIGFRVVVTTSEDAKKAEPLP
ncbi:MAG: formylglycine-generating enzyme family protein, partial [Planctomycetes bacterium]|nr:formylglycine-generating enzyme family protein [Planctomycetota bacterium]